ncbi:MAG: hypothetical protein OXI16_13840 [Chloroflexota bacterium]|nr:hypothetical protein [Chloroflexota bacterium]
MTTQYLNPMTNTTITVETVRDDKLNRYLANNRHLSQSLPNAYAPRTQQAFAPATATATPTLARDSYEREETYLSSLIKPDIRGLVRKRTIGVKKMEGFFRAKMHGRNSKRSRKAVATSRALKDMRRSYEMVQPGVSDTELSM